MRTGSKTKLAQENPSPGSPDLGESVFILIGKIRRAHGVDGEMIIDSYSESEDRFKPGKIILVGDAHTPHKIQTRRASNKGALITFKEITTPEEVEPLRNKFIFTTKDTLPVLPDGEYYHFQLIGLRVEDEQGKSFGKITQIIETGANDVYVTVDEDGIESLFPAIESVIINVNIETGLMVVHPQEWY